MEKKIERVPYISKWYKEELDWSQLFKFDFKDEPTTEETAKELNNCFKNTHVYFDAGSDWDIDKISVDWLNKDTTTISYPNDIHFWSPQEPQLKYVCNLTQRDIEHINKLINLAIDYFERAEKNPIEDGYCFGIGLIDLEDLTNFINNKNGVLDKCQKEQLDFIKKQSKLKKSYEGTLGEHWKELMLLFEIKEKCGIGFIKGYINETYYYSSTLDSIKEKLGIDFIKDFIKACEKCED